MVPPFFFRNLRASARPRPKFRVQHRTNPLASHESAGGAREQLCTDGHCGALISSLYVRGGMSVFRILVADNHPVFRLGVCSLLGSREGWEVCGEAVDGRDAVEKCRLLKPDLVV